VIQRIDFVELIRNCFWGGQKIRKGGLSAKDRNPQKKSPQPQDLVRARENIKVSREFWKQKPDPPGKGSDVLRKKIEAFIPFLYLLNFRE